MPCNSRVNVDLPDPLRPTTPSLVPTPTSKVTLSSAVVLAPGYVNETWSKLIAPLRAGRSPRRVAAVSVGLLSTLPTCEIEERTSSNFMPQHGANELTNH